MAVNVDAGRGMRRDVAVHMGLVVHIGDDDAALAVLRINHVPVVVIGQGEPLERVLVLVLRLEDEDGATIGDLGFGDNFADLMRVTRRRQTAISLSDGMEIGDGKTEGGLTDPWR